MAQDIKLKEKLETIKDDGEKLMQLVNEVNSYDDSLDEYSYQSFDDDFFETYFEGRPEEAARAVFFGNIQNWMDDYIKFNGYGNLDSYSEWQVHEDLKQGAGWIIDRVLDMVDEGDLDKEVIEGIING